MNNEPVAWMDDFGNVFEMKNQFFHIPLYTHPAKTLDRELLDKTIIDQQNEIKVLRKNLDVALMIANEPAKTLTDEEIMDESFKAGLAISKDTDVFLLEHDVEALVTFARAILRKAQEK